MTEPVAPNVPTPAMVTEVALLAFQFKVVFDPLLIIAGCAAKVIVGADLFELVDDG